MVTFTVCFFYTPTSTELHIRSKVGRNPKEVPSLLGLALRCSLEIPLVSHKSPLFTMVEPPLPNPHTTTQNELALLSRLFDDA